MSLEIVPPDGQRGYSLVRLGGRLDAHTAEEYKTQLQTLITPARTWVVGDLGDLQYISSAGLNLLIHVCRELRKQGGDFRLANVQSYVKEILDLTGATKIFRLYDSVEKASSGLTP